MLSTELSTALLFVSLAVATIATLFSFIQMQYTMRVARRERDYRRILLWLSELDDNHEALSASHKRLRSRIGMQELRAKRKGATNEPEEPATIASTASEEWKKAMRLKLHRGEIKP